MTDYNLEPLYDAPYYLIDIFPSRVPESRAKEYFAVEREYLNSTKLESLYEKFTGLLLAVNESYETAMYVSPEDCLTDNPDNSAIKAAVRQHTRIGNTQLFLPEKKALFVLYAEDLYITVYQPDDELLSLLSQKAAALNLYLRSNEVLI